MSFPKASAPVGESGSAMIALARDADGWSAFPLATPGAARGATRLEALVRALLASMPDDPAAEKVRAGLDGPPPIHIYLPAEDEPGELDPAAPAAPDLRAEGEAAS